MAGRIKGITVEIGGDTQGLDKALKEVNQTSRNLQSELRDVERLLKFDPGNAELAAQKQQLLGNAVENTEKKLQQLKEAQDQVQAQFEKGDIGADQYRAFQREVAATESELSRLQTRLEAVDDTKAVDNATEDVKELDRASQKAGDSLKNMGAGMNAAAKGIAGAAAAGAAGIGGLIAGTSDLNQELARLEFNAFNEGFDFGGVEQGFRDIVSITGETDSAVETLSNLMATGFDQNQLEEAVNLVNGAYLRFSDTLKTEGIADGIQETFATGKAIGPFAELLERSGVNLDTFNAGLAQAAKNGTETDFVLQTMSDLGLASSVEGFKEMNAELAAQQEAQINMQMALAGLSEALAPLATNVMNFIAGLAEWGTKNIELVKSFDSIAEGIVALLPQLFGSGLKMISTIVQAIVENLPQIISTGTQILLTLIQGIIQMLPSLIAQIQTMIPLITSILMQNLPLIISAGIDLLIALLTGISQMLPQLIDMALKLIVLIVKELLKHLPRILEAGVQIIFALLDGIIEMIPEIIDVIVFDVIPAIVETLAELQLSDIGEDIIQGLIDGINNMASAVWKSVKNIASGIGREISKVLKMGSPSKVLIGLGEDAGEGLEIGLDRSIAGIRNVAANAGLSIVDSITQFLGGGDAIHKYFQAIQEDGDWLNDWLSHMPKNIKNLAMQLGYVMAPALEGTKLREDLSNLNRVENRNLNVTINSPKQLNAREANLVWNRTMKKMQLQW